MGSTGPLHSERQSLPVESGIKSKHIFRTLAVSCNKLIFSVNNHIPVLICIHGISWIYLLIWLRQFRFQCETAVSVLNEVTVLIESDKLVKTFMTSGRPSCLIHVLFGLGDLIHVYDLVSCIRRIGIDEI